MLRIVFSARHLDPSDLFMVYLYAKKEKSEEKKKQSFNGLLFSVMLSRDDMIA
ncbi:hypothetical protein CHCC14820_4207 [Bacillus paralicheniformis]|uniref:Uncharacterized protein n=1 Tax=Bacillus paralicheniformis TaxID=1648923 RepID=A0ABY3FVK9_9BACI|nr:hypothetical protein B4123_1460 [Bacillus paralicheniformis]TWJ59005.1 hypothetical protein CHCC5022_2827 [Bacillus paralicheniformis]TWJ84411.1 hypothetical protein CHCC4186_4529 [Bacillus paralicheniformis]TWK42816.1 hypothetical protein CHCC20348_0528 [Bacillus paralicheniformis]TWK91267.1 hypothetical protein CHCC20333_2385 [Bacillus paralicheniformis]